MAKIYDRSAAIWLKPHDANLDQKYDVKKPRNTYPGLLVKDSYWRWPQRDLAGNAIDFFMRVLGLSFHQAMRQITGL